MRTLKIVTIAMAVMIVAGVVILGVTIMRRLNGPPGGMAFVANIVLDEPAGTRLVTFTSLPDRLAVQLQGGGPDRILFIDPRSGQSIGRVALAH
jgi:hypothetical protein